MALQAAQLPHRLQGTRGQLIPLDAPAWIGATAIGNQYTVGVAQVLHHIVAQVVANQVGIPRRTLREVL